MEHCCLNFENICRKICKAKLHASQGEFLSFVFWGEEGQMPPVPYWFNRPCIAHLDWLQPRHKVSVMSGFLSRLQLASGCHSESQMMKYWSSCLSTCCILWARSLETPSSFCNSRSKHDMEMKLTSINFSRRVLEGSRSLWLQTLGNRLIDQSPYTVH